MKLISSGCGSINVNTATVEELMKISGIGKAKAALIVAKREELGHFGATAFFDANLGISNERKAELVDEGIIYFGPRRPQTPRRVVENDNSSSEDETEPEQIHLEEPNFNLRQFPPRREQTQRSLLDIGYSNDQAEDQSDQGASRSLPTVGPCSNYTSQDAHSHGTRGDFNLSMPESSVQSTLVDSIQRLHSLVESQMSQTEQQNLE